MPSNRLLDKTNNKFKINNQTSNLIFNQFNNSKNNKIMYNLIKTINKYSTNNYLVNQSIFSKNNKTRILTNNNQLLIKTSSNKSIQILFIVIKIINKIVFLSQSS